MVRKIRVLLAIVFIAALTACFLGLISLPLTQVEFIPALLAADFLVVALILVLTALFGRFYCSILCPLGIFQDIIFWFKKHLRKKHARFSFQPEFLRLRYAILAVLFIAWVLGLAFVPVLLDPYSIYGRMVTNLLTPLWQNGNNVLAGLVETSGFLLIEKYDLVFQGMLALITAAVYFLVLLILAWRYGRLYCNTICPVGTMLGTVSRFSHFQMNMDADACIACGLCERHCRSACIDVKHHRIDNSRCVLCFECQAECPQGAIHFSHVKAMLANDKGDSLASSGPVFSRRVMLATAGIAAGTAVAGLVRSANSISVLGTGNRSRVPVMPPGAGSMQQFLQQCTACHLCIDRCPQQVLKPAVFPYGPAGIGKPHMDYSRGYCDYNCNVCGSVCPNGAIEPLSLKVKQGTRIGIAQFDIHNCLVANEGVVCGNCAIHCPAGAIRMEEHNGLVLPVVTEFHCIGCGSCEYHCPAEQKAIRVIGKR